MIKYLALSVNPIADLAREYQASLPDLNEMMTNSVRTRFDIMTRGATIFAYAEIGDDRYIMLAIDSMGVVQQIDLGEDQEEGMHIHPIMAGSTEGLSQDLSEARSVTSDVGRIMAVLDGARETNTADADRRSSQLACEVAAREAIDVLKNMQKHIVSGPGRADIAMDLRFLMEEYEARPN